MDNSPPVYDGIIDARIVTCMHRAKHRSLLYRNNFTIFK